MPSMLNLDVVNSAVPEKLLQSYVPFFTPIRSVISDFTGVDITNIVSVLVLSLLVASTLSYGYSSIRRFLRRWLSSSITIQKDDKLYEVVLSWIAHNATTNRTRNLIARSRTSNENDSNIGYNNGKQFNFKSWDASKPPVYTPAYGEHHFWYQGTLFYFDRERGRVDLNRIHSEPQESIHVRCWGFSAAPLKRLLQDCKLHSAIRQRKMTTIRSPHYSGRPYWAEATTRLSRPIDLVYLPDKDKENLIKDLEEFLHPATVTFYAHRGIPYRRGYLFYGPPGTGKTSLSLALAGMYGLELYVLSLVEHTMTDQKLSSLFLSLPQRCIVLFEDIDTAGLVSRKDDDDDASAARRKTVQAAVDDNNMLLALKRRGAPSTPPDKSTVTLSGLLNAIDGVASHEGRILIMTTNSPDSLDKALIRPGRVDLQIYFGYLTKENAREMFKCMFIDDDHGVFTDSSQGNAKTEEQVSELADVFASRMPEGTFTPAEVQGFLVKRRRSPQSAVDEIEQWMKELIAIKAEGNNIRKIANGSNEDNGNASPGSKESGEWVEKVIVQESNGKVEA